MNRCPKCGTPYPGDAKFCTKDGSKLLPTTAAPAGAAAPTPAPAAPAPAAVAPSGFGAGAVPSTTPRPTAAAGRGEPKPGVSHSSLVGQVLDKRYKIERKLGEGGMSFVYLGTDVTDNKQFAIKVMS